MNYRKAGFTQRKPKEPGVYFISPLEMPRAMSAAQPLRDGWDVAKIIFYAGDYCGAEGNREDLAHWQIHSLLGGMSYGWKRGMWIKGPISPIESNARTETRNDE